MMDFVGGGSVSDILEACEVTLSEAEARECTAWTVLALDYLHSNRKLHRVRTGRTENRKKRVCNDISAIFAGPCVHRRLVDLS